MPLRLTVACGDYDRTRAFRDGRVSIEGTDADFFFLPVEETFFRALRYAEFDVAELSLSSYTVLASTGKCPYTAIPVFLSRSFRHSSIYIRKDAGIGSPCDLIGRNVGVPEYQLTAPVWVRGILEDEYGVKPSDIHWKTGGVDQPGRSEKVPLSLPSDVDCAPIPPDETLGEWLEEGKIDALVAPRAPACFERGSPRIGRLFPDYRTVEKAYFAKTGIFPIMHVVGIRKTLLADNPWLPASLLKAFCGAKTLALESMAEVAALTVTLPWVGAELAETRELMAPDFWSYGVQGNEKALEAFLRYHASQGLSAPGLTYPDLFCPSSLEMVRV